MKLNWDELRCLVTVVEQGSLTAAAKSLGISQPTVGRRLKDLEQTLGSPLVKRDQDQYKTTDFGASVYSLAIQMRDTAWAIECKAREDTTELTGRIAVATTECIAVSWLSKQLADVAVMFPKLDVEVSVGVSLLDIMKREADIAIRIGSRGAEELVGEILTPVNFGLYASHDYLRTNGIPESLSDLNDHHLIDSIDGISNVLQVKLLREAAPEADSVMGTDSILTQAHAATHGMGIVALPYYLAYRQPKLERVLHHEFDLNLDLWLLIHRDLMSAAAYSAMYNHLRNSLLRDVGMFNGEAPSLRS